MNRIEKSAEVMASLGVGENDLAASFPEFEAVRNRFVYAEARTQGELDDRRRALVVVACLATLEAGDLAEGYASWQRQCHDRCGWRLCHERT